MILNHDGMAWSELANDKALCTAGVCFHGVGESTQGDCDQQDEALIEQLQKATDVLCC